MPNFKNTELRIKVIDRCLSDRNRWFSTAEMMRLCNQELETNGGTLVTASNTIRNDIEQIERNHPEAVVVSKRNGRNIYYHYEDPDYSIYKTALKPDELIQLTQTLCLLKKFKGMPQFDWITEIADRLGASLKIDAVSTDEIVGFDENMDLEGLDYFTPLFNAIIDKRPLQLIYKNFKQDAKAKITIHPYYLKQYNKRWFLIAWNADHDFLANFALDRIVNIKEAKVPFRPTDIDFFEYFDDMIGVSKDSRTELQKVKLWVSPAQWPYIKTKPLHGTQRTVKVGEDGSIIIIEVYLNYELEQLLLSFGEKVKVLEPQELKERIKQRLTEAAGNYSE